MNKSMLVGRENEIESIKKLMENKSNIIIFGKEGTGKSEIIRDILSTGTKKFLFSPESCNFKNTLLNLIISGGIQKENTKNMNLSSLKKTIFKLLDNGYDYIIFDHLCTVGPRYLAFFQYLIHKRIPVLIVSQGNEKKHIGRLWMTASLFEKVKIDNLDMQKSYLLIENLIRDFSLKIVKSDDFKREIFKYSGGNPKVIITLCKLARETKYKTGNSLNVWLMNLDRKIYEATGKNKL